MLQSFARERRTSGGSADEESARARVAGLPRQIADPLEAEHGIEDVERQHGHAVRAVARRCGNPGRHRARFGDAFLEDLTVARFAVIEQLVAVLGSYSWPSEA